MELDPKIAMGALQLAKLQKGCIYVYRLTGSGNPAMSPQPLPVTIPQWRVYPIGQIEFHAPVEGANEYFFRTVTRGLVLDLATLAEIA